MALPRILTLPVNGLYFDQIKSGEKVFEYRLRTAYWQKRIEGREYDQIVITRGYPKRDDNSRRLTRKWRGFHCDRITHQHFGDQEVDVYAIYVGD